MKTLLLIDAHSLIHRAYHALPPFTSPAHKPVGAIYGISSMLLKMLRDIHPDYVAAAFDRPEPTFRKELFADYKAHRPKAEDDLVAQLIEAHRTFEAFGISAFEKPGFEGDDIIGTLAKKFHDEKSLRVVILTGDLDTLQLVEGNSLVVETPKKGLGETITYDEKAVEARYALTPAQLADYKGLVGDPSDNIPGVKGVGPKTAAHLLAEYGTLENLFLHLNPKTAAEKKIIAEKDTALFSKKLAVIKTDVPLSVDLSSLSFPELPIATLKKYFEEKGFDSLLARLGILPSLLPPKTNRASAETPKDAVFIFEETAENIPPQTRSSSAIKIAYDWKGILKTPGGETISGPFFDIKIAGWLLDPEKKDVSVEALVRRFLKRPWGGLFPQEEKEGAIRELYSYLKKDLRACEMEDVFARMEMPLIPVLARMELTGIGVEKTVLETLGKEIDAELEYLTEKIYKGAGVMFNINSPKQVAQILFEKLELGGVKRKKTGTGQARTGKDVLQELSGHHTIVDLILAYREHFKIRSGFVTPLLSSIGADGRVHTEFLQTGTATGRIASENPNLQNIPQESKWSTQLRDAFTAQDGWSFLSFDYSQLELRLLAHVSEDKNLKNAFKNGEDVHTLTASRVLKIPDKRVGAVERRIAKTLNFGIIYGMGARAFAKTSGIPPKEAERFMEEYFRTFPGIKEWQERTKAEARTFGYVKNLNGRRRVFLRTGNAFLRNEMERAAINMPLQSLGADIIKLAMIGTSAVLAPQKNSARLVLSIHDELVFEIQDGALPALLSPIRDIMERVFPLSVPLRVEAKTGKTWGGMGKIDAL